MAAAPHLSRRHRSTSVQGHLPQGVTARGNSQLKPLERRKSTPDFRPASALSIGSARITSSSADARRNFLVAVRVRPPLEQEIRARGVCRCVEADCENRSITVRKTAARLRTLDAGDFGDRLQAVQGSDVQSFAYDRLFGMSSDQGEVYEWSAQDIVQCVLQGYNGSIIAYGQTSTGKTYTIEGGRGDGRGIIPRCCEEIFDFIQNSANHSSKFLVRASFLEIYNEHVMDLLESNKGQLKIRETPRHGMVVEGLTEKVMRTPDDIMEQLRKGSALRTTDSTHMNKASSRSHAVFTVIVEQARRVGHNGNEVTIGKLRLVDLAGSERFEADAKGKHIEETKNINTSLYTFGKVVLALTTQGTSHVPYRDSKLTRILQDSLGGNCKTTMISTVSPMSSSYNETVNTLKFAQRAKLVKNVAIVNKDTTDQALLLTYENEIKKLKEELDNTKSSFVDRQELVKLEREHQQAQRERDKVVSQLKHQRHEIRRATMERDEYLKKIAALEAQVLTGGDKIEETPQFQEAIQKEHSRLQREAEEKFAKLEEERKRLEKERQEFEEQKKFLMEQGQMRSSPDGGLSDEEPVERQPIWGRHSSSKSPSKVSMSSDGQDSMSFGKTECNNG